MTGYRTIQEVLRTHAPDRRHRACSRTRTSAREGPDLAARTLITVVPTLARPPGASARRGPGPGHQDRRAHPGRGPADGHPLRRRHPQQQRRVRRPLQAASLQGREDQRQGRRDDDDLPRRRPGGHQRPRRLRASGPSGPRSPRRSTGRSSRRARPGSARPSSSTTGTSPATARSTTSTSKILGMLYVGVLKYKFDLVVRSTTMLLPPGHPVHDRPGPHPLAATSSTLHQAGEEDHRRLDGDGPGLLPQDRGRSRTTTRTPGTSGGPSTAWSTPSRSATASSRSWPSGPSSSPRSWPRSAGMASGIAHEINNPLTGVLTYSSLLLEDMKGTPYEEDLKVIRDETLRCRGIVRGILDFARDTKSERAPADLNEIIEDSPAHPGEARHLPERRDRQGPRSGAAAGQRGRRRDPVGHQQPGRQRRRRHAAAAAG